MRLGLSMAVVLFTLICALLASDAGSAPVQRLRGVYHPSAVKGQTIELEIPAPPNAPRMTFKMQRKEQMVDPEPPFRFSIPTSDLRPANYKWHSSAAGIGCCDSQGGGGAIQIYPLPRVRAPKVSALVVAGTAHLVGLVVSRVAPNRVVRAWSFPRDTETGLRSLPLQLRSQHGASARGPDRRKPRSELIQPPRDHTVGDHPRAVAARLGGQLQLARQRVEATLHGALAEMQLLGYLAPGGGAAGEGFTPPVRGHEGSRDRPLVVRQLDRDRRPRRRSRGFRQLQLEPEGADLDDVP